MQSFSANGSPGGKARAAALDAKERSAIAKKAAEARWAEVPEAICGSPDSPLVIGDATIECYVLEDGRRVIAQSSFLQAFGRSRTARRISDDGVPPMAQGKSVEPFLPEGFRERARAIPFRTPSGAKASGYNAEILPDICDAFLAARSAGVLPANQARIAEYAEVIVRGLARVGIIALVDEATGYQDIRTRNALAAILEAFVSKELQPYLKTFPAEFYKQIFRLRGLEYRADVKRPQYFGHITNDIVYSRLAPGVLEELKRVQEKGATGRPRHKLFQRLTANSGYWKLREHLGSVVTIMKMSADWEDFQIKLNTLHPKCIPGQDVLLEH